MTPLPSIHYYRFGRSHVASTMPLPVLPAVIGACTAADIHLHIGPVCSDPVPVTHWQHHWLEPNGSITLSITPEREGYRLRFPALCDFLLDANASNIYIEPAKALDATTLEHLIVDQLLPRVLAHRGALVMHASAIGIQGRAILTLGHSGWGKSTLASLLHGAGHQLLSDDCALLSPAVTAPHVIPTYPSLRLLEDSIGQMAGAATATTQVATYSPKQRVSLGPHPPQEIAWPLRAIYLLNDPATPASGHTVTPLPPAQACMALVEHSFRLDLASTQHTRMLLAQAAAVLAQSPVFALSYPRDYSASSSLLATLTSHVASLPPLGSA